MPGAAGVPPDDFYNSQYGKKYNRKNFRDHLRKLKSRSAKAAMTYGPPRPPGAVGYRLEGYGFPLRVQEKIERGVTNN
jgi:hypothetical protein